MTIGQHHASLNRKTRDLKDAYASHREQVMRLIGIASGQASVDVADQNLEPRRIVLLGAGNGNDVDLVALTQQFDEVHLVDLDSTAIDHACSSPDVVDDRIRRHCPFDIASPLLEIAETAEAERPSQIDPDWLGRLCQPTTSPRIPPCDVVVSVGLLSQLMLSIDRAFSHLQPETVLPLIQTVRSEHFRRVESLLRPAAGEYSGGVAVFGFDFVSSESAPQIIKTPDDQLEKLGVELVNQRNFFSGMNPGVILRELESNPSLSLFHVQMPWRWTMGKKQYLMMAALLQRRTA